MLCRAAFVAVVQATDPRNRYDVSVDRRCRWSRNGRILAERQVRPGFQIVLDVSIQDAAQPALIADDDVIEAFVTNGPINRSAHAFCQGARTAVITSAMPIAVAIVAQAWNAVSRSWTGTAVLRSTETPRATVGQSIRPWDGR